MSLDLRGFVEPENNFEGLSKITNTLERKTAMQQRAAREAEAKKFADTKFLTNYLSDKDKYTGTNYDPETHKLITGAMDDAMSLINQGADINDVVNAISPKVNKASTYVQKAQQYAANKKEYLANLKGVKGIDLQKVSDNMDKIAFEGKDVADVDPNANYADMALKQGGVFNNEGFGEVVKGRDKNTEIGKMKFTNPKGGMQSSSVELSAPNWAVSDVDKEGNHIGFVPKFQVATDAGEPILHQFQTDNGTETAPVRLLDKDEFDKIMNSKDTGSKGYILQEVSNFAKKHNVNLNSTQAENLARAIAYDEMKPYASGTYKHYQANKENPAPHITVNVSANKAAEKAALTKNDLYTALDETPATGDGLVDITPLTGGIKVFVNSRGKQISQPRFFFNPKDKTITYSSDDNGGDETVSLSKFKSMAKSNNSKEDLDYLEFLRNYKRGTKDTPAEKPVGFIDSIKNFFGGGAAKRSSAEPIKKAKFD